MRVRQGLRSFLSERTKRWWDQTKKNLKKRSKIFFYISSVTIVQVKADVGADKTEPRDQVVAELFAGARIFGNDLHPVFGVARVKLEERRLEDWMRVLRQRLPLDGQQLVGANRIRNQFDNLFGVGEDPSACVEQPEVEDRDLVADAVDDVVLDADERFRPNLLRRWFRAKFDSGLLLGKDNSNKFITNESSSIS